MSRNLFIGGSMDGRWMDTDGRPCVKVTAESEPRQEECYIAQRFRDEIGEHKVYVLDGLKGVMAILLLGYKP